MMLDEISLKLCRVLHEKAFSFLREENYTMGIQVSCIFHVP